MYSYDTHIKVRYKETDQMGIVHHSNYYPWFEEGRTDFLASLGRSYGQMEKDGFLLPLLESHCVYKKPAYYEDRLIIRTYVKEIKGVRITFGYRVLKQPEQVLIAEGYTVHAFVNKDMKPINVKKIDKNLYNLLYECLA
ncbi:acyl-CoA thioesterase [Mahella australiensis]|uniref:Thioesterase superfamily protein n=1 Tax=Mahella australiensis (strain DSM 15567 / CIP 107919 / 50-1 BON) TaxID=697281 RepID=F4A1C2_MAHA5|nr:thioesterase family protein [Mahella australiensis]AEE97041.1 thioesterase superfamily protein [Mahella australiensis 50-1 BON]